MANGDRGYVQLKEARVRSNFSQNLSKGQSVWSWHSGTVLLLVIHVTLPVWSHSQLSAPFQEKVKPFQLWENTWTSHLPYWGPLTLSPLSHQTLKITNFCLQSLDTSPSCALIAFGPPTLVSHICKLHESGFSGDHLILAGHLRWKNSSSVFIWSVVFVLPFLFPLNF